MEETRRPASELPCLFEYLTKIYPESLPSCITKENQTWRFASGAAAVERINIMAKYFPELSILLDRLDKYSLCERHYNQVVAKEYLLNNLKKNITLISLEKNISRKKLKHDEIQINSPDPEITRLTRELSETQKKFEESEKQRLYYVDIIKNYEQINEELKNINASLLFENEKLKERLNTTFDDQQTINN